VTTLKTHRPRPSNQDPTFYKQKDIDHAWDKFLCSGGDAHDLPVRDLIVNSWERCLTQGVNPEQKAAPLLAAEGALYTLRQRNNVLMECARPVLQQAKMFLRDLETILFVTDYQGVNLEVVGDPRTIEDARGIGLVPGGGWKETVSGSNAVGTAMATRRPTQVHGEEHYCQGFKPWTCTAGIISDPYDHQMIGVIDVSGLSNIFDKFHVPLIVAWASEIQAGLAQKTSEEWHLVQQHIVQQHWGALPNCQPNRKRSSGNLLLDRHGRLIDCSQNASSVLNTLDIEYDPMVRSRLSLERFGGAQIPYPHDDGLWISDDWVEPIHYGDQIIGFQIHVPPQQRRTRRAPVKPEVTPSMLRPNADPFREICGTSDSFKASTDKARKAAVTPLPVLILGETGVGKEVFARAIHETSHYADGPFIDLNCGAFTKDLLNGELFGHVEGAFTGAKKGGMMGKIEAANGGTLFLDEIGEMPLELQPIFLRVLQERKIYRVGDVKPIPVEFRLISATNSDLRKDVAEGRFRKDLFFRLSTVSIGLDPLSSRKEDIESIARLVLERTQASNSIVPRTFSPALLTALKNREWPGNIRELVNVVECMCFMSQNETLSVDDLPDGYQPGEDILTTDCQPNHTAYMPYSLDTAEQQAIEAAIQQCGGNMTQTAKTLGIAKSTLYQKMKKYGLENHR
jgi:transcriptional regulator of acetoin/glycerol metabolism